jgi:uncharacterized protein YbaA (DUF1428 family)
MGSDSSPASSSIRGWRMPHTKLRLSCRWHPSLRPFAKGRKATLTVVTRFIRRLICKVELSPGALGAGPGRARVVDCWHDEVASNDADFHAENAMATYDTGSLPNFRRLAGAVDGQIVVVSITEWPSRQARDLGTKAAVSGLRILATIDEDPIFDGKKLIAGDFTVELDMN